MTIAAGIRSECDQIMTDVDNNETESLSTITTPTLSYCPLSEDSNSDQNTTPSYQTTRIDCTMSPDLLTKNLLNTPRNRLSYQGDIRNKSLPYNRHSFQEIKFKNVLDNWESESFNNKKLQEKIKSDISILTDSLSSTSKNESLYAIVGNNYERLGHKNSILNQEDSSYEESILSCKSSIDSIENFNFKPEKTIDINYEILVVTSPESCNSSQHEMSGSLQVL